VHKFSSTFLLLALMVLPGCVAGRHAPAIPAPRAAPPIPKRLSDGQKLLDYYPDASKRAHEQGRVVIKLQIGASGELEQPIQIDRERTDATARLAEAAQKILSGAKFDVGDTYKKNVTVSIVFELVPCGAVTHDPTTDYRINLCLDPSPYANFNFAEHPPSEFEAEIDRILIHDNLADIDFLEETLGLRFRVTRPVLSPYSANGDDDHSLHVLVTPISVPKTFRVQGLEYWSPADPAKQTSSFHLDFYPVKCPDIGLWAARLKVASTTGMDPHGYGSGTDFQSGGEHGISVNVFYHIGGWCRMFLSQTKELGEPFSSHTDSDLISPTPLVRGIGAVIAGGDIRNVALAERALHASFTSSGQDQFGLNYQLQNIVPGVDPVFFEYSVNDTGREPSPFGAFFAVPPIPAEPKATLRLIVDVYHLCIRRGQLPSELHRRGIRFRGFVKDAEDIYVIRGRNAIRVELSMFGGCVRDLAILQMTNDRHVLRSETSKKQSAGAVPR
jgi:Gram-negative bacterial TonB protein C-terminal